MKNLLKISVVVSGLLVGASAMQLQTGWNLVALGDINPSSTDCILNQLPQGSLLFKYNSNDNKWLAKSNDQSTNSNITDNYDMNLANIINPSDGFWVYNKGSNLETINPYCQDGASSGSQGTVFTYGGTVPLTLAAATSSGKVYFGVDSDGYDKIQFGSNGVATDTWYEKNGAGWSSGENSGSFNIAVTGSNTMHYVSSDGQEGNIAVNFVKKLLAVDGNDLSSYGIVAMDMNTTVTKPGDFDNWDPEGWQPSYYDTNTNTQKNITDIQTYVNHMSNANEGWWQRDGGEIYMFAASNENTTSGNIVKAIYKGQREGCNGNQDECSIYQRGSSIIGSWSIISGDVLQINLPTKIVQYRFLNAGFEERKKELAGNTDHMQWIYSSTLNPSTLETSLRTLIQQ